MPVRNRATSNEDMASGPDMMSPDVLVIGDVMTDVVVRADGPLLRGTDQTARIVACPGGAGANQALWLAHFGANVRLAARVGQDDQARLAAQFGERGIDARLAADPDAETGTLICLIHEDGERSFFTDRAANRALCGDDLPVPLLDGVGAIHVSGYALFQESSRRAVQRLMTRAMESGLGVSIDAASAFFLGEVGPNAFLKWCQGATLVFANADEAAILTGAPDRDSQLAALGTSFPVTVLKQGKDGAVLYDRDQDHRVELPAQEADIVDTTGAGDAFLGAFLAARLSGSAHEACLSKAVAAGTYAALHVGGQPPVKE